jgi:hypothetical protein
MPVGGTITIGGWSFTVSAKVDNSTHWQYSGTVVGGTLVDTPLVRITGDAMANVDCVMIRIDSPIYVSNGERACFSVHSNLGTQAIKWARAVTPFSAYQNDGLGNILLDMDFNALMADPDYADASGFSDTPTLADGAVAFEVPVTYDAEVYPNATYTPVIIEILVDLRDAPDGFVLEYLLLERNRLDHYFDGNTVRGGWLIDASSVSDFRWEGSAFSSRSLYADDYVRTSRILDDMLIDEVVPVNETGSFQIVSYDAVHGV